MFYSALKYSIQIFLNLFILTNSLIVILSFFTLQSKASNKFKYKY